MFGYATDETEENLPLTLALAHKLNQRISDLRRNGDFWWARPDSKTQVRNLNISFCLPFFPSWLLFTTLPFFVFFSLHQVTCEYFFEDGACVPKRVHTVVVSVQHSDKIELETLRSEIMEKV